MQRLCNRKSNIYLHSASKSGENFKFIEIQRQQCSAVRNDSEDGGTVERLAMILKSIMKTSCLLNKESKTYAGIKPKSVLEIRKLHLK